MPDISVFWGFWDWAVVHSTGVKWTDVVTVSIAGLGVGGGLVSYNRRTRQEKIQDRLSRFKSFMEQNKEFEENLGVLAVRAANSATLDLRGRPFKTQAGDIDAPNTIEKNMFHGVMIFEHSVPEHFEADLQLVWSKVTFSDKYHFMTFYERIQIMIQSELMTKHLAFYLFGVEYLSVFRTKDFWNNFERPDDSWWSLNLILFKTFEDLERRHRVNKFPVRKLHV